MKTWIALAVLGVIGFGLVGTGVVQLPDVDSITRLVRPAPAFALPGVELKSLTSEYGFLQGSFVISNTNAVAIADTAIHCDVQGPDKAAIHAFDFVIAETVPASGQTTISNYKFGFWPQQSSRVVCRSVSAERQK